MPTLHLEKSLGGIICGIDEAGRGPWAGPVVAAALILGKSKPRGINDSKKLTPQKREEVYAKLIKTCQYGVGMASVEEIDNINILQATKLAMQRAYEALQTTCDHALIDGNQLPKLPCNMQYVIKGDSVSYSIAAASIIAKVTRDRILCELHEEFPHYGWNSNKGYCAKFHRQAVEIHGLTPHHRKAWFEAKQQLELAL